VKKRTYALDIAFMLLNAKKPISTSEITEKLGCDRKTVYSVVDEMESAGFCTRVIKQGNKPNKYEAKLKYDLLTEIRELVKGENMEELIKEIEEEVDKLWVNTIGNPKVTTREQIEAYQECMKDVKGVLERVKDGSKAIS